MTPLEQLRIERSRLKEEIAQREDRISRHLHDFEKNFMSMAIYSLLPMRKEQKDKLSALFSQINHAIGSVIPVKMDDEKKSRYEGLMNMAQMAAAGIAIRYFKKLVK